MQNSSMSSARPPVYVTVTEALTTLTSTSNTPSTQMFYAPEQFLSSWSVVRWTLGAVFALVTLLALIGALLVRRGRRRLLGWRASLSLCLWIIAACCTRAICLLLDPWGSAAVISDSVAVTLSHILMLVSSACLTAGFILLVRSFLHSIRFRPVPSIMLSACTLFMVLLLPFLAFLVIYMVVLLKVIHAHFVVVCEALLIVWGVPVYSGYCFLSHQTHKAVTHYVQRQEKLSAVKMRMHIPGMDRQSGPPRFTHTPAAALTLLAAVIGLATSALHSYELITTRFDYADYFLEPSNWLIYQCLLNSLEFALAVLLLYVATLPLRVSATQCVSCSVCCCAPCLGCCRDAESPANRLLDASRESLLSEPRDSKRNTRDFSQLAQVPKDEPQSPTTAEAPVISPTQYTALVNDNGYFRFKTVEEIQSSPARAGESGGDVEVELRREPPVDRIAPNDAVLSSFRSPTRPFIEKRHDSDLSQISTTEPDTVLIRLSSAGTQISPNHRPQIPARIHSALSQPQSRQSYASTLTPPEPPEPLPEDMFEPNGIVVGESGAPPPPPSLCRVSPALREPEVSTPHPDPPLEPVWPTHGFTNLSMYVDQAASQGRPISQRSSSRPASARGSETSSVTSAADIQDTQAMLNDEHAQQIADVRSAIEQLTRAEPESPLPPPPPPPEPVQAPPVPAIRPKPDSRPNSLLLTNSNLPNNIHSNGHVASLKSTDISPRSLHTDQSEPNNDIMNQDALSSEVASPSNEFKSPSSDAVELRRKGSESKVEVTDEGQEVRWSILRSTKPKRQRSRASTVKSTSGSITSPTSLQSPSGSEQVTSTASDQVTSGSEQAAFSPVVETAPTA